MSTESINVPHLLSRRKQKHIAARGVAEVIDLVLIAVVTNALVAVVGDDAEWCVLPLLVLYFTALEAWSGQTIGKRVVSLRVVNSTGRLPSIGQSLIRNLVRPFEAFGLLGIFLVASTEKGQRIGDFLASTFVVRSDELENLANTEAGILENRLDTSREVIPISSDALELAKTLIAGAYKPDETGLSIAADESLPNRLAVQLDLIDSSDDCWHHTTDGVTIAVPRALTEQCVGVQIVARNGKLVVDRAP